MPLLLRPLSLSLFAPAPARALRFAAAPVLLLVVATLGGCTGSGRLGGTLDASLSLRVEPGDLKTPTDGPLPATMERRWAGENLLEGDAAGRRLNVRLVEAGESAGRPRGTGGPGAPGGPGRANAGVEPGRTLRDGWVRLPAGTIERFGAADQPLPAAQLRRPALNVSLVGLGLGDTDGEGLAVAQIRPDLLDALARADTRTTPEQALWLALLGVQGSTVTTYARLAGPATAEDFIRLREAGVHPARLAELDAEGVRFTSAQWVGLAEAGVTPEEALQLRRRGVSATPAAMVAAAGRPERVASRAANDPVTDLATALDGPAPAPARAPSQRPAPAPAPPEAGAPVPAPAPLPTGGTPLTGRTASVPAPVAPALAPEPEAPSPAVDDASASTAAVPARYAELMGRLGYTDGAALERLFRARVEPRSVRDFVDAGHNPTADELVAARELGVDGTAALAHSAAGYRFSVADLIELAEAGVDADYAVALVDSRYPPLSKEQLLDLHGRGVTPEQVQAIRAR